MPLLLRVTARSATDPVPTKWLLPSASAAGRPRRRQGGSPPCLPAINPCDVVLHTRKIKRGSRSTKRTSSQEKKGVILEGKFKLSVNGRNGRSWAEAVAVRDACAAGEAPWAGAQPRERGGRGAKGDNARGRDAGENHSPSRNPPEDNRDAESATQKTSGAGLNRRRFSKA